MVEIKNRKCMYDIEGNMSTVDISIGTKITKIKKTKIEMAYEKVQERIEKRKLRKQELKKRHEETIRINAEIRMKKIKDQIDNTAVIRQKMPHRLRSIITKCESPFKESVIVGKGEDSGLKLQYPNAEVLHMSLADGMLMAEELVSHKQL